MKLNKKVIKSAISLLNRASKKLGSGHWARGQAKIKVNGVVKYCATGAISSVRRVREGAKDLAFFALAKAIDPNSRLSGNGNYDVDTASATIQNFNDRAVRDSFNLRRKFVRAQNLLNRQLKVGSSS